MSLEDNLAILVQAIGSDIKALNLSGNNTPGIQGPQGIQGPKGDPGYSVDASTAVAIDQQILSNLLNNISILQTQVVAINTSINGIDNEIFDSGNF